MGGESSKSDNGAQCRVGRRKSTEAMSAFFVANVCSYEKVKIIVDRLYLCELHNFTGLGFGMWHFLDAVVDVLFWCLEIIVHYLEVNFSTYGRIFTG